MVNKFFAALNDVWREESQHYEQAINRRGEELLRMQGSTDKVMIKVQVLERLA